MAKGGKTVRAKPSKLPAMDERILEFAVMTAAANWLQWLADWNFNGDPE